MATMIAACEAAGIEPVLVTYPPYAAAQDRINGYNAVVLSGALGRHRVIDIAAAVTVGGDRVTPIAGYFNADNLHLTVAGHRAVWVDPRKCPLPAGRCPLRCIPGPAGARIVARGPPVCAPAAERNRHNHDRRTRCQRRGHDCRVVHHARGLQRHDFLPFFAASAVAIRAAVTGNVYAEII
jgi:hypothetical protein